MASELVQRWGVGDVFKETGVGYNPWSQTVLIGDGVGLRLHKLDTQGYILRGLVPGSLTMGTGLTFGFELALPESVDFPGDVGKVVRLGVTVKRIISGESLDIDSGAGTEQTVDVTLQATVGLITVATLAIANANLDSTVVGNRFAARVRRIGSHANDTCLGSVAITSIDCINT